MELKPYQVINNGIIFLKDLPRRHGARYVLALFPCGQTHTCALQSIVSGNTRGIPVKRKQKDAGVLVSKCGASALVDTLMWEPLKHFNWLLTPGGYLFSPTLGLLHREVLRLSGADPCGFEVDHINGQRLDCRLSNLHLVTHQLNNQNQKINSRNTSGNTGITWDLRRSKWCAYISVNKKRTKLVFTDCLFHAFMVREKAAQNLFANNSKYLRGKDNQII